MKNSVRFSYQTRNEKKNTKHAEEIKRPSAGKNTNEKFKMVSAGEKWERLHEKCCDRVCAFKKTLKIIKGNTQRQNCTIQCNALNVHKQPHP